MEKFQKGDPVQFLPVHGRPMKIHVDPAVATVADSPVTMYKNCLKYPDFSNFKLISQNLHFYRMPWQGQTEILIDRFDVRAHLDVIPCHPPKNDCDTY